MLDNNLFGYSLSYSLQAFEKFKQLSPPEQAIYLQKAQQFENLPGSHFMGPDELAEKLGGSSVHWRAFLTLKPVRDYIQRKVEEDTEILNRQSLYQQALKAAKVGDNQAAKYLNQLAEAYNTQTNQVKIILHYIPRPNTQDASVPKAD